MTAITLPNAQLAAGFLPGESGWSTSMNANLRILDALVALRVADKDLTAPPAATGGSVYIIGASPTGAWAGRAGQLALWCIGDDVPGGQWLFVTPKDSWRAWVVDEGKFYQRVAGAWVVDTAGSVTPTNYQVAIGNGADASFVVNHGLGTRAVHVTIYRNAAPYDQVIADVAHTSVDTLTISGFTLPPATGQFTVAVSK